MEGKMKKKVTSQYTVIICILAAFSILGCISVPQIKTSDNKIELKNSIGWLHGNCFAVRNPDISKNSSLIVVRLDNPNKIIFSKIIKKTSNKDECYPLLEDRRAINIESGLIFYTVSSEKPIELGIGILQRDNEKALSPNELLDLNGDGRKETFSQCSTSEGIQFSVWDGVAYKSNLIWSDYYYLGYDTESNCPLLPLPNN